MFEVFKVLIIDMLWMFVLLVVVIYFGELECLYCVGGDSFFIDVNGESKILVIDYVKVMFDEV